MIESPPTLASSALSSLHQGRRRFTVLRPLSTASRDAESNYSASSSSDVEDSCFQTAPSSPAMTSPPPHHRHSEPRDAIDNDPFSDYGSDISLDDNLLQLLDAAVPASSSVSPSRTDPLPTSHPNPTAVFQEHDNLDDARIDVLEHAAVVHPAVAAKGVLQSEGFPSVDPASSPNYGLSVQAGRYYNCCWHMHLTDKQAARSYQG